MRVRPAGTTVFEVLETDYESDPDRVLVQAVGDAPGRYPFSYRVADLIPADTAAE